MHNEEEAVAAASYFKKPVIKSRQRNTMILRMYHGILWEVHSPILLFCMKDENLCVSREKDQWMVRLLVGVEEDLKTPKYVNKPFPTRDACVKWVAEQFDKHSPENPEPEPIIA